MLKRGVHIGDGEVRQRRGVARTGAAFMNAEHRSTALALPAAAFFRSALGEVDAEQA